MRLAVSAGGNATGRSMRSQRHQKREAKDTQVLLPEGELAGDKSLILLSLERQRTARVR